MISRVLTRFSGINKFKITQPEEILLLPKVELMEIFWLEGDKKVFKGLQIQKIPKNFLWCGTKSSLIIKDGQDAHPTKLGNLFFGVP
jgi:hypothetical protein